MIFYSKNPRQSGGFWKLPDAIGFDYFFLGGLPLLRGVVGAAETAFAAASGFFGGLPLLATFLRGVATLALGGLPRLPVVFPVEPAVPEGSPDLDFKRASAFASAVFDAACTFFEEVFSAALSFLASVASLFFNQRASNFFRALERSA